MPFDPLLTPPPLPDAHKSRAEFGLRYDDLDLHGRLQCLAAAHSLGPAVWRAALTRHPIAPWCFKHMVLPILSRLLVERGDGPLAVRNPVECAGAMDLAHVPGDAPGSVDRIMLLMWVELTGPIATTNGPKPPNAGAPSPAGWVYAEHVLTAALAPPGERKVRRLGGEGVEPVPSRVYVAPPVADFATLPDGAVPLGGPFEEAPFLFGLLHTDANLHVNSLVYLQLFEETALRRLAALGEREPRLARTFEVGYRKPFFAGERTSVRVQAFRRGETVGACGAFYPVDAAGALGPKASAYVRVVF